LAKIDIDRKLKYQKIWLFSSEDISGSAKKPDEKKKVKRMSPLQARCQLVQTSFIEQIKFFFFVLMTSVKILPYRPPAWLIRAEY